MAWSPRELAELAGTTVNTVRHYHRTGLLEDPERRHNGYKQYEVRHLVSLLRIRRLASLGVPLSEIGRLSAGGEHSPDMLRELDAELGKNIRRLQEARRQIDAILREDAPAHGPVGFESVASHLSEADSSMIHIYTQLFDAGALADVQKMVEADSDGLGRVIDRLPADADDATRQGLAERLAATLAQDYRDYPWLRHPAAHLAKGGRITAQTFADAITELYNPAQLDVIVRANAIAVDLFTTDDPDR